MFNRAKQWLRKSGLKKLNGEEILDSLNPLDRIIEDSEFPWTKIYRESIWVGIIDTWHVLMGNHYATHMFDPFLSSANRFSKNYRKGVLDVLLFPSLSRRACHFAMNLYERYQGGCSWELFSHAIGTSIMLYIVVPLELTRFLLASAFTLLLVPVVSLVHLYAHFKVKKLEEKAKKLKILKYPSKVFCLMVEPNFSLDSESFIHQLKKTSEENENCFILIKRNEDIFIFARSKENEWKISGPLGDKYLSGRPSFPKGFLQIEKKPCLFDFTNKIVKDGFYVPLTTTLGECFPSSQIAIKKLSVEELASPDNFWIHGTGNKGMPYATILEVRKNLEGIQALKELGLTFHGSNEMGNKGQKALSLFEQKLATQSILIDSTRYQFTKMTGGRPRLSAFEIKVGEKGAINYRMVDRRENKKAEVISDTLTKDQLLKILGQEKYDSFLSHLKKENYAALGPYLSPILMITSKDEATPSASVFANDPACMHLLPLINIFSGNSEPPKSRAIIEAHYLGCHFK